MTDTAEHSDDVPSLPTDLEALRDRDDVPVSESTRPIPDEKFAALRERYDAIAGVVQMGLTNGDGEVLLWGDDSVAPPGESVDDGADWDAAARDALENLTGQRVEIDEALLLEVTHFARESDESETFPARSVHFAASLVDPIPSSSPTRRRPTTSTTRCSTNRRGSGGSTPSPTRSRRTTSTTSNCTSNSRARVGVVSSRPR